MKQRQKVFTSVYFPKVDERIFFDFVEVTTPFISIQDDLDDLEDPLPIVRDNFLDFAKQSDAYSQLLAALDIGPDKDIEIKDDHKRELASVQGEMAKEINESKSQESSEDCDATIKDIPPHVKRQVVDHHRSFQYECEQHIRDLRSAKVSCPSNPIKFKEDSQVVGIALEISISQYSLVDPVSEKVNNSACFASCKSDQLSIGGQQS